MDAQRKLLDALMGSNRNGDVDVKVKHYTDRDVCKYYLCGLCPHELFVNTKMDKGECEGVHSDHLRSEYDIAIKKGENYGYERDLEHYLDQYVAECDRKINRAQKRLAETADDKEETNILAAEIKALTAQAEELGAAGNVEESMKLIARADELKQKQELGVIDQTGIPSQQQKLRVCEVCGAFLSIYDSDRRLADHFGGKLHMGYLQIRERLKELRENPLPPPTRSHRRSKDSSPRRERHRRSRSPRERRHKRRHSRSRSPSNRHRSSRRRSSGQRERSRSPRRRRHRSRSR